MPASMYRYCCNTTKRLIPFGLGVGLLLLASCGRTVKDYLERGNKFFAAGRYADADLTYRKAIQKDTRSAEAHYRLALAEEKLGHPGEAYRELSQANTIAPDRPDVQAALADIALKGYLVDRTRPKRLYDQLTALAQKMLARDPKSFDGLRIKAYLAATDGKTDEALGYFRNANATKPFDSELTLLWTEVLFGAHQDAEAEKLLLALLDKNKTYGRAYDLMYRRYVTTGRMADAQNLMESKVRNNPNDAGFALQLAAYYASAGKRQESAAAVQRLLDNPKTFPKAHLQVGDFYAKFQEWDQALKQYDEGAKADPKDKLLYLKRTANLWLSQGKGEQAAGMVDQILKEDPKDEEARAVKASLNLKSGDPKKLDAALAEFQDLVAKNPNNPVLRLSLGHAYMAKGNSEAARSQYLEALKRYKDYGPAFLAMAELSRGKNDYTQTLHYSEELLKLNPNQRTARLLRASALIGTGDANQARDELTRLEKDFPQFQDAQLEFAYLDASQKKFPEAEARLRKLLDQQPGNPAVLSALVQTLTAANQQRKAFDLMSDAVKKAPDSAAARLLLAETAVRVAQYDMAIEQYRLILTRNPRTDIYARLSSTYTLKGDKVNALASLESAEKLAPSDPAILAMLAQAMAASGRKQEAVADYRRVLKLKPENASVMNNLAFLIVDTGGQTDEALRLAQQAVQKAPQQPNFSDTLGWIYFKQGLTDASLRVFRNLSKKYPENATFHYHLGMALRKTGDETTARKEFQLALSKKPSGELTENVKLALAGQAK